MGVWDSPRVFIADLAPLADLREFRERCGFREVEVFERQRLAQGIRWFLPEENKIVRGGRGEREGIFEIGSQFLDPLLTV